MFEGERYRAAADYAERVVGGSTRPERPISEIDHAEAAGLNPEGEG